MLSYLSVDWGVPFPIAPLLAATAAAVVGVLVGLPALRLRGLMLGVVTFALAFGIEAIWFRNADLVQSDGNTVGKPEVFGIDLGVGAGKDFPRLSFGFMCLIVCVVVRRGCCPAAQELAGIGDARGPGQRALGRGYRRQRRLRQGRSALRSRRSSPGSPAACSRTARASSPGTASPRSSVSPSCPPRTSPGSPRSSAASKRASSPREASSSTSSASGSISAATAFVIISGVLVIVTLIRNPEGLAAGGHELADRFAAWRQRRAARPPPTPADGADVGGDGEPWRRR